MVKIDKEKCISCQACVLECPEGFEMGDDGKAKVKDPNAKCIQQGIDICPVDAIS